MARLKYKVLVTYVYGLSNFFDSDSLITENLPNTESGLAEIHEKLEQLYPYREHIRILGLIPLAKDRTPVSDEDDD